MSSKSKIRAPNFTKEEQLLLWKVMEAFIPIIENKKTGSVKHCQKQEAWAKVTEIYNANTKNVPRTSDNLLACYRNMKSKMKKQRSEAKMLLDDSSQKEALLVTLEKNGKDWELVAQDINQSLEVCLQSYVGLQKELKKMETQHKKVVMGTGGGSPSLDDNDAMKRLKKIIIPQMEGLYTTYDADATLMKQFQESQPEHERIMPIEINDRKPPRIENSTPEAIKEDETNTCIVEVHEFGTPKLQHGIRPFVNRTEILKKRKASALNLEEDDKAEISSKKKKNLNDSFLQLSEAKLELVNLQKISLELDIAYQKRHHAHQELMRQKELLLIDLKIKKESA